ncbi:MAG: carbon-nitrogen hydrolase family protein [Spirochaetes bacterium]|jgi:predicted amidohydrolase|nr:carbon-nitrogen hydrolase family protein [Spirochaetota bacterium]
MRLRIASIQMISENNDIMGNRVRAMRLIGQAIKKKARLILLPEFALNGYTYTDDIWKTAEPLDGPTARLMKDISKKHRVYIGTCILEKAVNEFYDTFILVGPGKDEFWSHRKIEPATYEAFFFRGGGVIPGVFDTPLGRIGVAICFDTSKTHTLKSLADGRPDLVLIPFSCPGLPTILPAGSRKNWDKLFIRIPFAYAEYLGVPVITSNKTGGFISTLPLTRFIRARMPFIDVSQIVDRDGTLLARAESGEQVLVSDIEIRPDSFRGLHRAIPAGRWLMPYTFVTKLTTELSYILGRVRYTLRKKF